MCAWESPRRCPWAPTGITCQVEVGRPHSHGFHTQGFVWFCCPTGAGARQRRSRPRLRDPAHMLEPSVAWSWFLFVFSRCHRSLTPDAARRAGRLRAARRRHACTVRASVLQSRLSELGSPADGLLPLSSAPRPPSRALSPWGHWSTGAVSGESGLLGRGGQSHPQLGSGDRRTPLCPQACRPASWRSAPGPCGPAAPTATSPVATASATKTLRETTGRGSPGARCASQAGVGPAPGAVRGLSQGLLPRFPPRRSHLVTPEGGTLHPALSGTQGTGPWAAALHPRKPRHRSACVGTHS